MYQLQWRDRIFSITVTRMTALQEIGASFKLKKTTDKTSSSKIIVGNELQEFPVEYDVSPVGGVDPVNEYKTMKSYLGLTGPLLLEGSLFGPNYVILEKVSLDAENVDNTGRVIKGKISLTFKEYSPQGKSYTSNAAEYISPIKRNHYEEPESAVEKLALKVLYNGTDITDAISVNSCIHDMYACSTADTLLLKFNDVNGLWDGWQAGQEEIIEVVCGIANTGKMYIDSLEPENGLYTLRAMSVPPTAKNKSNKSWENVKFLQLAKEIADRHNLGFESYGVDDWLYAYVRQDNDPDFEFLQKRCELESCAFVVYNQKLVVYSEEYIEKQEAKQTLTISDDAEYEYSNNSQKGLGSMSVKNGNTTGTYISSNGLSKAEEKKIKTYMSDFEEAVRFAKGIWRQQNKNLISVVIKDALMREYSAGSILNIETKNAATWNGKYFVSHIRQDYVNSNTKLFSRKAELT